jgi:hypothetical protein
MALSLSAWSKNKIIMIHSIIHFIDGRISPFRRCLLVLIISLCVITAAQAQFAPAAGSSGSTAIHYDEPAFVSWATACSIYRGYRDIAVPDSGYATVGDSSAAIGMATTNGIVSLGDGGSATLTFDKPIVNGTGFDFAIFENGFSVGGPGMAFLELAFVDVSSDGIRFVRFPAADNTQDSVQIWNGSAEDCSLINNLAGKYTYGYGTPFDLDDLKDSAGLDINSITHVRVVDVIGSISDLYASRDINGHKINDPYPTNFGSSGFDLDAVGVIHQKTISGISDPIENDILLYPNPTSGSIYISSKSTGMSDLTITDVRGKIVTSTSFEGSSRIDISALPAGIYAIRVIDKDHVFSKLIVKE